MTKEVYRYTFTPGVPLEDLEASLLLAILATESLHGEAQVPSRCGPFLRARAASLRDRCGYGRRA